MDADNKMIHHKWNTISHNITFEAFGHYSPAIDGRQPDYLIVEEELNTNDIDYII